MRKIHVFLIVAVCMVGVFFSARWLAQSLMTPPPAVSTDAEPQHLLIGEAFLDHLDASQFDQALAMTTVQVQEALAGDKLEKIWAGLPSQLGARKSRSPLRGEEVADTAVVTSTLVFGLAALDARIAVDSEGKIAGFRLVPAAMPEPVQQAVPSDANFSEHDFPVGGRDASLLPGTLSLPHGAGPFPAIVLVHGSGPHDRDETIGPNKPFRDLAHRLSERGIAVLRYEKRTKAYPEEFAAMDFTVDQETVDDAIAAVAQLRGDARIAPARVFIAGHSLGALMAPRMAQRAPELAGLILLAAPARPLQDIVLEQVEHLAASGGELDPQEQASIDDMANKAAAVATLSPDTPANDTLLGLPAAYWIDLRGYDPIAEAQQISQPMLVIQGGRDYQVTAADDFSRWQAAFAGNLRVRLKLIPALNHLLIAGQGPSLPKEYALEGHVDISVVEAMVEFVDAAGR